MKNINKLSKIIGFISFLAAILWLGTYLLKVLMIYRLYLPSAELLRMPYTEAGKDTFPIFATLLPAFSVPPFLFIIFLITFVLFIITSKLKFRQNGWLFIITVLVAITSPFEIWSLKDDLTIMNLILSGAFNGETVMSLLTIRIKNLSSFPIIIMCCYVAAIYFAVFQPFTKRADELGSKEEENEN